MASSHGFAIRSMVYHLTNEPADRWFGSAPYNCSFTIVEAEGGRARITDIDRVYYDPALIVDYYRK